MALQPIGPSGVVFAKGGYVAVRPNRPMGRGGVSISSVGFAGTGALRPISPAGTRPPLSGIQRGTTARPISQALNRYSGASIASFLNLRFLSLPFASYSLSTLRRSNALRSLSPGYELFVPKPPEPVVEVDVTLPIVSNFTPSPGTPISRAASVSFNVTDNSGSFRRIFVVAYFPSTGIAEVIHDGDGFRGYYAANSARAMIALGFRYTVARTGGWPAAPTVQTFAIDATGNEAN